MKMNSKSMSGTKRKWNEEQQRQQNVNKQGHEFCYKLLKCQFKTVSDVKEYHICV